MIASLRGVVLSIGLNSAVIECSGVGYQFTATPNTLAQLRRGEEAFILTTMTVREDATNLYGFPDETAREMFVLLQSVSGLGPRLALACESVLSPVEIAEAIVNEESKTLQRVPGVGKRMADRMIVELKDKMSVYVTPGSGAAAQESAVPAAAAAQVDQVSQALVGLGFTERQADQTVAAVLEQNPDLDTSAALRAALAMLGGR